MRKLSPRTPLEYQDGITNPIVEPALVWCCPKFERNNSGFDRIRIPMHTYTELSNENGFANRDASSQLATHRLFGIRLHQASISSTGYPRGWNLGYTERTPPLSPTSTPSILSFIPVVPNTPPPSSAPPDEDFSGIEKPGRVIANFEPPVDSPTGSPPIRNADAANSRNGSGESNGNDLPPTPHLLAAILNLTPELPGPKSLKAHWINFTSHFTLRLNIAPSTVRMEA